MNSDGPTDGPTDKAAYRVACTPLKTNPERRQRQKLENFGKQKALEADITVMNEIRREFMQKEPK